jgi:class 3 adenylate cyclase/pimeloyl-ACP methyl ester carboxylesterase
VPQHVETRYAKRGDVHIAYQVVGEGPVDLVYVRDPMPADLIWQEPSLTRFVNRLASFTRLIVYDPYGCGASDQVRIDAMPMLQEWGDDLECVLEAVGSQQAAVLGEASGGFFAAFFAATRPERTSALILANSYVKIVRDEAAPWGLPRRLVDPFLALQETRWGTGANLEFVAPSHVHDDRLRRWFGLKERLAFPPATAQAFWRMGMQLDMRPILPAIGVPTLVFHTADNRQAPVGNGRYLAEHICGCTYVELPGDDHLIHLSQADTIADGIEGFITGMEPGTEPDRILVTLMFTDISGSTKRLSELGDRAWKGLLDVHDEIVRQEVERYKGREVKTTGDGVLATFDGPARAVHCATQIAEAVKGLGIEIHAGLHTGEVELRGDDVGGVAVHIAARINALAAPGEVLVSRTVKDLVTGSGIRFADRGAHTLKGIPEEWQVFAVEPEPDGR